VEAPARGDADLLGRLLLNLLDNAIKFSEPGGRVEVTMSRDDGRCAISVVDAGVGVPPEAAAQIFEPFFRVDRTRAGDEAAATGGAGLGLAIARRIANLHDGRLELVESRPGRTEFRLTLPIDPAPDR
jgi:signal transduction histidine kinase